MKASNPPVTRKELAYSMGIHTRTLYRWLKRENICLHKRLISPREQTMILRKFGYLHHSSRELESYG